MIGTQSQVKHFSAFKETLLQWEKQRSKSTVVVESKRVFSQRYKCDAQGACGTSKPVGVRILRECLQDQQASELNVSKDRCQGSSECEDMEHDELEERD